MATTKAKKAKKSGAAKKAASKSKATAAARTKKSAEVVVDKGAKKKDAKKTDVKVITAKKTSAVREFFGRKFDKSENILTIFKRGEIFGALIGEALGVAFVTMIALTLGLMNPLYMIFGYLAITLAVFRLSGANLNPIVTVGMLATRRMSAIRGVLYIIAQILGAWIGFLIVNGFYSAGLGAGMISESSASLPTLTAASDITTSTEGASMFWPIVMLEFLGAIIIAFMFARALVYKRSAFTFSAVVSAGVFLALLIAVVVCSNFFYISDNVFVMNPAVAFVYGLFPSDAGGFDELMKQLMPMLVTYVIFPILGGAIGFYLSDIASKLAGDELAN